MQNTLAETFGNIDIYLFDQLLKGRYDNAHKVLDVGCGNGRNLFWFLRNGYEVYGIDPNPQAVDAVKQLSATLAPGNALENFLVGAAENLPGLFPDFLNRNKHARATENAGFGLIICSAVLHFAKNEQHFESMLQSIFSVLRPGGYFFGRLASVIGLEASVQPIGNGRYLLPDGTERFLVSEQQLLQYTAEFGELYEPIKTTNVQNARCMTTWCVQKSNW